MEEERKKKKVLPIVALICVAIMVIALGSYALWQITAKQTKKNVVGTACLSIDIENESGDISIENGWPVSDSEGANTDPYMFTVTNHCEEAVNYVVALESLEADTANGESSDYLDYSYIRVKLDNASPKTYGTLEGITNDSGVRDTKEITHHTLGANDSVTHNLRIWVKEDTPLQNEDESYNTEKYFYGRIKVTAGQNISGDTPVTIGVLSGDVNTVGSEVQIGDEHFYVIGDDEEVSGNVKLLAKYNLLVGETNLGKSKNSTEEECASRNGTWYGDGECDYGSITYDSSTPGYNLQSSEARGAYCTLLEKYIRYYDNVTQESCESAGGNYDSKDYECKFIVPSDDTQYDNLTQFGEPSIKYDCSSSTRFATVEFSEYDNGLYWADYQDWEYTLKTNYSLQSGQTMPYVYYDNNKSIDSHSIVAPYVNNYKNAIESNYRVSVSDARLLRFEEVNALGCSFEDDGKDYISDCSNAPDWLVDRSYWLGSAYPDSLKYVFGIDVFEEKELRRSYGYHDKGASQFGVRPVISVSKSIFNN